MVARKGEARKDAGRARKDVLKDVGPVQRDGPGDARRVAGVVRRRAAQTGL